MSSDSWIFLAEFIHIHSFYRSNEELIGGDVENLDEEERDELADLPHRVDGSGVTGLLNPKLTTIDIRQVQLISSFQHCRLNGLGFSGLWWKLSFMVGQ